MHVRVPLNTREDRQQSAGFRPLGRSGRRHVGDVKCYSFFLPEPGASCATGSFAALILLLVLCRHFVAQAVSPNVADAPGVSLENAASGRMTTSTTALGRVTKYQVEQDATGARHLVNTFPDGTQSQETKTLDGTTTNLFGDGMSLLRVEGPDGRFGMLTPVPTRFILRTPAGLTATKSVEQTITLANPGVPLSVSNLTVILTVNGRVFTSSYSATARTFTNISAMGRRSRLTMDTRGRPVTAAVDGLLPVTFAYNARGRLTNITQGAGPDARTASFVYDGNGCLSQVTDPLGRFARFAYDATARLTNQTLPDGRTIRYAYDLKGNFMSVTPPGRLAHKFSYTPVDLISEYIPPAINIRDAGTRYAYNQDRDLTRVIRSDGLTIDLVYDNGGSCNCGKLTSIVQPRGTHSFYYDPVTGNLANLASGDGVSLSYAYDGALLTNITYSGAVSGTVNYTYDSDFRVASVGVNGSDFMQYRYDGDGFLTNAGSLVFTRSSENGFITAGEFGNSTETRAFNGFGQLETYRVDSGGKALFSAQYSYDKLGRVKLVIETIVSSAPITFDYSYDLGGRLMEAKENGAIQGAFTYDANGNHLTSDLGPATYDAQDRLVRLGLANFEYGPDGERLTRTIDGQVTSYSYDALGNLVAVKLPDGRRVDYFLDALNRRVGQKVDGVLSHFYLYDDESRILAELDGHGKLVSRFVYGDDETVPSFLIKSGQAYRLVTDLNGSVRLVIHAASGTIAQRLDYDAFGKVLSDTNPGFQPLGFASGHYDPLTGLTHFGARDYDAEARRWITTDPLLFGGLDANLYAYAFNDPVNFADRTGGKARPLSGKSGVGHSSGTKANPSGIDIKIKGKKVTIKAGDSHCSGSVSSSDWAKFLNTLANGQKPDLKFSFKLFGGSGSLDAKGFNFGLGTGGDLLGTTPDVWKQFIQHVQAGGMDTPEGYRIWQGLHDQIMQHITDQTALKAAQRVADFLGSIANP